MPLLIDIGEPKWYHWTIFYTKSVLWNLTSFRMWMTPSVKIINSVAHLNFTTFLMILYFTLPSSPPSISAFTVSLKIAEVKYYSTHSVDDGSKSVPHLLTTITGGPSRLVWLGVKLQEGLLRIWTRHKSKFYFTRKMFIFRNIYRWKSTIFRSPYYSL